MAEWEMLLRPVGFVQSAAASDEASDAVACVAEVKMSGVFTFVILTCASLTCVSFAKSLLGHDLEERSIGTVHG